jgi:amidophosphoribosyltransferase
VRPACPPLAYGCKFLNFSRSRSELDLAARKAISELEGQKEANIEEYSNESSDKYTAMVARIGQKMGVTTLRYQKLDNMIRAIGMPKEKLCTFCWTGKS